jgi:hypothetical protein
MIKKDLLAAQTATNQTACNKVMRDSFLLLQAW